MADLKSLKLTTATDSGYVTSAGASDAQAANIMLNSFRVAIAGGLSVQGMVDGVVDEFEDETGVATAQSNNETYDTSGDFYHNPGVTSGNVINGFGAGSWQRPEASFDGNTTQTSAQASDTQSASVAGYNNWLGQDWGEAVIVTDLVVHSPSNASFRGSGACEMKLQGSTDNFSANVVDLDSWTSASGTGIVETRDDSNIDTSTAYRYHRVNWNGNAYNGITCAEVNMTIDSTAKDMTIISSAQTALTTSDTASLILFEEDVDATTINTDLVGFATRDAGRTFTTDFGTDEKLDIAAHAMPNNTRVTVSSSTTLPAGLIQGVVYYVVNQSTNDFELSLTSGGGAVNITDNGTGTHTLVEWAAATLVDQGDYDTSKQILADYSVDLTSQPSGTSMKWMVETLNTKNLKVHGVALQWS